VSAEEKKNEEVLQVTVTFGDEEERLYMELLAKKKGGCKRNLVFSILSATPKWLLFFFFLEKI
jgi:hypothetical protein